MSWSPAPSPAPSQAHDLPAGVFSFVLGDGVELGQALVRDPRIKAVGFTGSRAGGLALVAAAAARPEPIPVYAEMSSINPVVVLPGALAEGDVAALATAYVGSLTLGSGQFCTNPGLLFLPEGPDGDAFLAAAGEAVREATGQRMLTEGIAQAYAKGTAALRETDGVSVVGQGTDGGDLRPRPAGGRGHRARRRDRRGVRRLRRRRPVRRHDGLLPHLERLEGQLTATVHYAPADVDAARQLLPVLEVKAGRILFNGWPTGVEVGHAMVHGGPFPATSDSRTTSVGIAGDRALPAAGLLPGRARRAAARGRTRRQPVGAGPPDRRRAETAMSVQISGVEVVPVAGHDSMLLNLSGAHGPFFTRNIAILTDSDGRTGLGEVPGGEADPHRPSRTPPSCSSGQPVARFRRLLREVAERFADRDAGGRGLQTFDLRTTVHAVTALESALLDLPARRSACRSPSCSATASSATACRCSATCSTSATRTRTDLPYLREHDGATTGSGYAASRRSRPRRSSRSPRPRRSATASPTSS